MVVRKVAPDPLAAPPASPAWVGGAPAGRDDPAGLAVLGGGRCISGALVGTVDGAFVTPLEAPLEPEHPIARTASAAKVLVVTVPRIVPPYARQHTHRCMMYARRVIATGSR